MRVLIWDNSFKRAFKRVVRKNPRLEETIFEVLELLTTDPFAPALKSHKLKGDLDGLWACWVEYDCRIIYTFEPNPDADEEMIVLIDIGSHDEVY
ncbi:MULTISPECIES: type II toxin-antitoxin system YafQ family toxin [Bromeliae group (in: Brasilonema)]|uniref:Type II toxin-antitoxin system mRNA interferase toxin, RelE/StbE family n=2 Tax=Bromeliae group (in: Brasilonema) TaxID=3398495 RepID=A0A856M879_9CYAN|nr:MULTISPECIES: type II toxin-antitoxin system mRNA interferase toxin, RelE/StbE family [Brasilonema]NMG21515.1 type II toxin-antitoxin system mRNA interferase toxin, RelE/StbE family [Brasilonema bromeliae SPC951]QDL07355.1 type II toxin-antitoxin system mRNA interferase toxin, RelE/StbE family [Brasilonema sennae CENA114]QDL13717.1 type II toxin-antitoxin system mRNA interferase toxin, RelE/StbE family [Brasilonema octagenarum UFV-E1]